ncbi:AsmA family protein [Desulfoplanes sp. PS50]
MRALKIILIILAALVVLVGGSLAAIFLLVDPNDYKDDIAAVVTRETGRELSIPGDISLSVFPWLGLEMGRVSLGNAPGFSDQVFAGIDKAELRIKIMPLLKKEVRIGTIVLDGFQLNLEKKADGTTNWADLGKKETTQDESAASQEAQAATSPDAKKDGLALAALTVDGVRITNGRVTVQDMAKKTTTELGNVEMSAEQISFGSPFSLFFGFDLQLSEPELKSRITLNGQPLVDPQAGTYTVQSADLNITGTGKALPGGTMDLNLKTDLAADLTKETLTISNLVLTTYGLNLQGRIDGQKILAQPAFTGELHLAPFNPRELMQIMGLPAVATADPTALTRMQTDLNFTAGLDQASLTSLTLLLDDTTVQGSADVKNFSRPAIVFGVDVDAIDVDRYLPPKKDKPADNKQPAEPKTTQAQQQADQQPVPLGLPMDTLRNLDVTGKLTMGTVTVSKLNLSKILVHLVAKNGRITMDPISANLYEGIFGGTALLDVSGATPTIKVTEELSSMQVGPLLKDLTGKDTLTGTTRSSASLTTSGMNVDELKAGLNGNLAFDFSNGAVKGINLPKMLRDAVTRIKGGTPDPSEVNQTDFAALNGTARITNGVLDNRDLLMMSPLMRVNGAGTVNLPKEGLDYLLKATVVSSLKGQQGEPLSELAGLTVPVRITGSFDKPAFKLDIASLLRDKGVQELKEKVSEKLFKDKKPGEIDPEKTLKGLFK